MEVAAASQAMVTSSTVYNQCIYILLYCIMKGVTSETESCFRFLTGEG